MPARIILLVTSPRLPVGLLSAAAWDVLRAHPVLGAAHSDWRDVLGAAGVRMLSAAAPGTQEGVPDQAGAGRGAAAGTQAATGMPSSAQSADPAQRIAALLAAAEEHGTVIWFAGPDGDPELARGLGLRLARQPGMAELEVVYGSWDPPGARLLDAVAVMDRLVSPGGDPWKRQQTHESLARYLLEEAYEAHDAIGAGDLDSLRDELGDLLLQVLLHARLAEEQPEEQRWSVDDVAAGFVAKMIRRNPHVFAGAEVSGIDEIIENWERIKQQEQPRRGVLDGVPLAQPALSLAAKLLSRAERAGATVPVPGAAPGVRPDDPAALGEALLGLVAAARAAGVDAEAALRRAVLAYADRLPATGAG